MAKRIAVLTNSVRDFKEFEFNNQKPDTKYKHVRSLNDCSGEKFSDWIRIWDWQKITDPYETFDLVEKRTFK